MKVFSKEKFLGTESGKRSWKLFDMVGIPENERWPSVCDGKTPEECNKLGWIILDDWCIEKGEDNMKEAVQKFVDEKIAIAFTNPKQIREFAEMIKPFNLNACDEPAYDWLTRSAERLFDSSIFGKHAFVYLVYNFRAGAFANKVSWSANDTIDNPYYINRGWHIMAFETFKNLGEIVRMSGGETLKIGKQEEKYKIEIVCDGDKVTVARMIINGETVKTAEAHRNPTDKFNFRIGAEYAFNRLFAKKMEHDGCDGCVWEYDDEEQCVARGCRNAFCYPENLKKPDKYTKKQDFEIGDRVVCASAKREYGYESAKGEHGRVIENRSTGAFVN